MWDKGRKKAFGDETVRPHLIGWSSTLKLNHVLSVRTCEPCSDWSKHFSPAFEEGNVNWRRVEVDKLEDENFEDEHVFIFSLSPMHL